MAPTLRITRAIPALLLALSLLLVPAAPAQAYGQCAGDLVEQFDMQGTYHSDEHRMLLTIYPCGGIVLTWTNRYGTHQVVYETFRHLPDGLVADLVTEDPDGGLDGEFVIGIKAAEPGWVQLITDPPSGMRIYRLRKFTHRY